MPECTTYRSFLRCQSKNNRDGFFKVCKVQAGSDGGGKNTRTNLRNSLFSADVPSHFVGGKEDRATVESKVDANVGTAGDPAEERGRQVDASVLLGQKYVSHDSAFWSKITGYIVT